MESAMDIFRLVFWTPFYCCLQTLNRILLNDNIIGAKIPESSKICQVVAAKSAPKYLGIKFFCFLYAQISRIFWKEIHETWKTSL